MSTPMKIIYDKAINALLDSNGNVLGNDKLFPSTNFGQKKWVNLQVVENGIANKYDKFPAGITADIIVDNDYKNPPPIIPLNSGTEDYWENVSGSEYKYYQTFSSKPDKVYENTSEMTEGTIGSLAAGEWGWDSNNEELYVRLSDSTDPDSKADGYITYRPGGTYTPPFIEVDGSTFNQAGSWYDEDTKAYRNPNIQDGEITFLVLTGTKNYYERIEGLEQAPNTTCQIQLYDPSADFFDMIEMFWICRNRYLGEGTVGMEVTPSNFYTKAQTLALINGLANKAVPSAADNIALLDASGDLKDSGVNISAMTGDEKVKASATDVTAGYLDTKVDNTTIEVASNKLSVKAITASLISDFDTEVSNNADVAANTSHRGDTSSNPHNVDAADIGLDNLENYTQMRMVSGGTIADRIPVFSDGTGKNLKMSLLAVNDLGDILLPAGGHVKIDNIIMGVMSQAEADELTGGGETDLHSHDSANLAEHGIYTPATDNDEDDKGKVVNFYYSETDETATGYALLLHCNGNDGSTVFPDRSPYTHTVTAHGGAQCDTDQKYFDKSSAYFPITSVPDYLTIPDHSAFILGTGDFRIGAFIRFANDPTDSSSTPQMIICQQTADASSKGWKLFYDPTDGLSFSYATNPGDWTVQINKEWSPLPNVWYRVDVKRHDTKIQLFIDGNSMLDEPYDCGTDDIVNSSGEVWIAASPEAGISELFDGWMDEILIDKNEQSLDDFVVETVANHVIHRYDISDVNVSSYTPVGSIVPWVGGYWNAGMSSFTNVLGNTVADVNNWLAINSPGWKVCDGSLLYDVDSPIFSSPGRYLPDLTDNRFLMGSTSVGIGGGSNTVTLTTDNIPAHTHTSGTLTNSDEGAHTHANTFSIDSESSHTHTDTFSIDSESSHTHTDTFSIDSESSHTHTDTFSIDSESSHTHGISLTSGASTGNTGSESSHTHGISLTTNTDGSHTHGNLLNNDTTTFPGSTYAQSGGTTGHHYTTTTGGNVNINTGFYVSSGASSHSHAVSGTSGAGSAHSHSLNNHTHSVSGNTGTTSHTHGISGSVGAGSAHSHNISGSVGAGSAHSHGISGGITSVGNHTHTISGSTGTNATAGNSFDNRPLYLDVFFIMRYK